MANAAGARGKRKSKLIFRLLIPMLFLVILQIVSFFAILVISGEFSYVRQYAYNTLVEKTENRKNYIESELQQKIPAVQEYAGKINDIVEQSLEEQNAEISDLKTNKELDKLIMRASVHTIVDLLRRSMANDAYLILDTGELYRGENGIGTAKPALYLRDLDPTTDAGYGDLLMEHGLSSISQEYGIILDSGWKLHFEPDKSDMKNYDFYYRTIQTAQESSELNTEDLGCWTAFSSLSQDSSASPSMKYTVPLIAADGTVYGIIGIGLTENTILSNLPVNDFLSETACYVLGYVDGTDRDFNVITHSGVSFNRLVRNEMSLPLGDQLDDHVYDFALDSDVELAGSVQYINLYNHRSPYHSEHWALISIADRNSVLKPLTTLVRMLFIAAAVTLIVCALVVILISRAVVGPISAAIKTMNNNRKYNQVIRFEPTRIYELDEMTDAITRLQRNVQDFSSQVSKMIRIANVGLGTFLYDRTDDSVFVGQSLLPLLNPAFTPDEDVVMDRESFIDNIIADETRLAVMESLGGIKDDEELSDTIKEYSISRKNGNTLWMRLTLVHKKNTSIGILQDITDVIMQKKRIEYERDYDNITGLLNRSAYQRRLERLFRNSQSLKVSAFIMIDLDNLKFVNDTYGHDFGDDYIKTAATTLKNYIKHGGIVCRLSGDEFSICLHGFSSKEEVRAIIDDIRSQLMQSYCLLADGTHFKIRASTGVSWYPSDSRSYEMLMKYADFAMYTVKHSTKGEVAEFDMTAYAKDSVLITGVEEMNRIIDECRVQYAFHSIVSAKTGEIYGYEALMRPQSTILQSPLELLRIAKTGAKLYEIERLTWTRSLADFQKQIDAGRIEKDAHIFINSISNCSLEPGDADAIGQMHPELLSKIVLEILESENVNEEFISRKMRRMRQWEAQIALDDFGTGYNSEYALITIHPNIIKIDRSIISGCDKDISRRMIITNLVKMVSSKHILVLAEGVETEEELATVIDCGVDLLQGYYICRPVFEPQPIPENIAETIKFLAKNTE